MPFVKQINHLIIMKKVLLTLALAALATGSAFAQISVGAGYLSETQKNTYSSGNNDNTTTTNLGGFYVGADYTLDLGQGLGVMAGLKGVYYTHKGEGSFASVASADYKTKEFNLVVPVDVTYAYTITPDLKVFAFAGPSFSFGLSSKTDWKYTVLGNSTTTNVNNYDEDYKYKKFNLFLGAGVGVDVFDMIRVKAGYDIGLLNRSSADNTKINDAQWYVGVAYLF